MSSNPEYKSVSVLEVEKNSGKNYQNEYIVEVIKDTDETLIGDPVKNINDRIRVEKVKGRVLFYKSEGDDTDERVREETLEDIRDKAPGWLDDYIY